MQMQKDNDGWGLRGCQLALRKLRTKAKGCQAQIEGEEKDLSPNGEERKKDG